MCVLRLQLAEIIVRVSRFRKPTPLSVHTLHLQQPDMSIPRESATFALLVVLAASAVAAVVVNAPDQAAPVLLPANHTPEQAGQVGPTAYGTILTCVVLEGLLSLCEAGPCSNSGVRIRVFLLCSASATIVRR